MTGSSTIVREKILFAWELNRTLSPTQKLDAKAWRWKHHGQMCELCERQVALEEVKYMTIHHLDRSAKHPNLLKLILLADGTCNQREESKKRAEAARAGARLRLPASMQEREREIALVTGVPDEVPYEVQTRLDKFHLAERYAIKKVKEGWVELKRLERAVVHDVADPTLKVALENATQRLTYGVIVGGISGEFGIAKQTAYNWASTWKNRYNGFLRVRDLPEGKLLDFADPEYHKLEVEEIYRKHPASGRHGTENAESLKEEKDD